MSYEFSDDEAAIVSDVGTRGFAIGILAILLAIFDAIGFIAAGGNSSSAITLVIIRDVFIFLIGVLFLLPFDNLRKVDTTQGNDIKEMMEGIRRLNVSLMGIFTFLVIILLLELTKIMILSQGD